jgi:hypothetical protein
MKSGKTRFVGVIFLALGGLILQGCSSSGTQSAKPLQSGTSPVASATSTLTPAPSSAVPSVKTTEINPNGDIPDNTQYVRNVFNGRASFVVPEGWSRQETSMSLIFTDKLNTVTLQTSVSSASPTVGEVLKYEVPMIQKSQANASGAKVESVKLKSGPAILLTYKRDGLPNDVTGKVVREAVERFTFTKGTTRVDLILSCPISADNVDPWRIISNSYTWLK